MKVEESKNDVGAFIAVFAALLLDNVLRLEETVDQVTKLVMGSGRPDRELIVTLQSFDRHKQEFEALGDALTRYAEAANAGSLGSDERAMLEEKVISAITVADLKDRLLSSSAGRPARVCRPGDIRTGGGAGRRRRGLLAKSKRCCARRHMEDEVVKVLGGNVAMHGFGYLSHSLRDGLATSPAITPIWSVGQ